MNSYAPLCDDFGMSVYLHSKLEMPTNRETVLHFFEAVQKAFPKMTDFEKRESGEYMLEEDREAGSYRWTSLDARRLCTGFVNPPALEDGDAHNERVLEMPRTTSTCTPCRPSRWTCSTTSTSCTRGTTTRWWPRR